MVLELDGVASDGEDDDLAFSPKERKAAQRAAQRLRQAQRRSPVKAPMATATAPVALAAASRGAQRSALAAITNEPLGPKGAAALPQAGSKGDKQGAALLDQMEAAAGGSGRPLACPPAVTAAASWPVREAIVGVHQLSDAAAASAVDIAAAGDAATGGIPGPSAQQPDVGASCSVADASDPAVAGCAGASGDHSALPAAGTAVTPLKRPRDEGGSSGDGAGNGITAALPADLDPLSPGTVARLADEAAAVVARLAAPDTGVVPIEEGPSGGEGAGDDSEATESGDDELEAGAEPCEGA